MVQTKFMQIMLTSLKETFPGDFFSSKPLKPFFNEHLGLTKKLCNEFQCNRFGGLGVKLDKNLY